MRRACRKILRSVPCTNRRSCESRKDMEEILRAKLSTINEEPELCEENLTSSSSSPRHMMRIAKKQGKKKNKTGLCLVPHVNLKQSYVLFINGFASKTNFAGFLQR